MVVSILFADGVLIGVFESRELAQLRIDYERRLDPDATTDYKIQLWQVID